MKIECFIILRVVHLSRSGTVTAEPGLGKYNDMALSISALLGTFVPFLIVETKLTLKSFFSYYV